MASWDVSVSAGVVEDPRGEPDAFPRPSSSNTVGDNFTVSVAAMIAVIAVNQSINQNLTKRAYHKKTRHLFESCTM